MEIYYTIFILLFSCCFLDFINVNFRTKRNIIIIWCVFFTLFGGLRWNTGGDFDSYYEIFKSANWDNVFNYYRSGDRKMEPGFMLVNISIKTLVGKFYFYNIIIIAFIQFSYYKFCTYFCPKYPILLFSLLMIMSSNYFAVRAGLSMGFVYLAYRYFKERDIVKYMVIIACASLIHNQCLIMLPLYWIGKVKLKSYIAIIILLSFSSLTYVFQNYFTSLSLAMGGSVGDVMYHYTQRDVGDHEARGISTLLLNLFFLLNYLYVRKKRLLEKNEFYNGLLNMFLVYIGIQLVFSQGMGEFTRLAGLLFPAQALLLIHTLYFYISNKEKKFGRLAILFFIIYYVYKIYGYCDGFYFEEVNVPYRTIFDYNII